MERYDIAIIGTGPAGISAAITAKIRNKRLLLFGSQPVSPKVEKAHEIQNYPGLPAVSGAGLAEALTNHLAAMDIAVTREQVGAVYEMGGYYGIQTGGGIYEAQTVILATGVAMGRPLPGEEKLLGRGVSYCATCDAPLYRGKTAAVIGYNAEAEAEADFLSEMAAKVYYFPMYKPQPRVCEAVEVVRELPEAIEGEGKVSGVRTREGNSFAADGVFVLRDAVAADRLVPGLATDGPHAAVNLQMETNLPGCFACGDLAGRPYQYIKAAGQGNVAALSAVAYLDGKKRA